MMLFTFYHNRIDATGDLDKNLKIKVLEIPEETIKELTDLVRQAHIHKNASHISITSDHGFISSKWGLG